MALKEFEVVLWLIQFAGVLVHRSACFSWASSRVDLTEKGSAEQGVVSA